MYKKERTSFKFTYWVPALAQRTFCTGRVTKCMMGGKREEKPQPEEPPLLPPGTPQTPNQRKTPLLMLTWSNQALSPLPLQAGGEHGEVEVGEEILKKLNCKLILR